MSTEERRTAWLCDEMFRRVDISKRDEGRPLLMSLDRDEMRDRLMTAARGTIPIHVIDAWVEQLVQANCEHLARMARLRAEFKAETAALRREIAETEARVRALLAGDAKSSDEPN
jgi:hypothetical protein